MKPLHAFLLALVLVAVAPCGARAEDDPPREEGPMVTFDVTDKNVREMIQFVAEAARVNIVVAPDVAGTVTLRLERVPWRSALELLVEPFGCRVVDEAPNVVRVEKLSEDETPRPPPSREGALTISLTIEDEDVRHVIGVIAEIAEVNIIVSPAIEGRVSVSLRDVPWRQALEQIVAMVGGAVIEEDSSILRIMPRREIAQLRYYDVKDLLASVEDLESRLRRTAPGATIELKNGIAVVRATPAEHGGLEQVLEEVRRARAGGLPFPAPLPPGLPPKPPLPPVLRPEPEEAPSAPFSDAHVVQIHGAADLAAHVADLEGILKRAAPRAEIRRHRDGVFVVKASPVDQQRISEVLGEIRAELRAAGVALPAPLPARPPTAVEPPLPQPPEPPRHEVDREHWWLEQFVRTRWAEALRAREAARAARAALLRSEIARMRAQGREAEAARLARELADLESWPRPSEAEWEGRRLPHEDEWERAVRGEQADVIEAIESLRGEVRALREEVRELKELLKARDR